MNNMKKFASLLLALVMVLAMAVPAMAEDGETATYTITVNNAVSGYTYEAYQIFDGDLSESILSNIVWGTGIDNTKTEALMTALKAVKVGEETPFANCTDAASVAEVLSGKTNDSAIAQAFADTVAKYLSTTKATFTYAEEKYTSSKVDAGYYLIKNTAVPDKNEENDTAEGSFTRFILKVVKNVEVTHKGTVPSIDKTVTDTETGSQPDESADANIGDTVTFTLTATMPTDINGYGSYKVVFHDTLSSGLDYVENSAKVMIGEKDVTTSFTISETDGNLTISCDDVLAESVGATANSKIVVTYTAIVDDDAVIGSAGNSNKVYLEFSNDPNWNGEGDEPTGDTPEDEVKVYTWEIPAYKWTADSTADNGKKPLAGAGFTLYTDANCTTAVNLVATTGSTIYKVCTQTECSDHKHVTEITTDNTGKFEIEGLQKGTYYLKETTTPAGYNTCDVVTVVIGENGALTVNNSTSTTTEVQIENKAGSTLPETGGMGTTVIYVAGGLLVAAAVIMMVAKRRRAA